MSLKVYFDFLSPPSRALLMFLKANRIPFEPKEVKLAKGEHFNKDYANIHPFQKVPAIIDDQFQLIESVAILRYLCRERNVPEHWYPKDVKGQAKVDEYLEWQHTNTRMCGMLFMLKWVYPSTTGKAPNAKEVAHWEKLMNEALDKMEYIWLKDKPYLTGDRISIADLLGVTELEQTRIVGYNPYSNRAALTAWLERIKGDTNPYFGEVHGKLHHFVDKYKGVPPARTDA
ncbi:hypothetical protein R5R35_002820 [Gryllus longicercus]|uniref:Uncharacterized protein n=1 Tax=Gryllus longicercus TaxID=2509291 RepID=A0AAN9VS68_9ORTH